jgi:two-component system, OmpR family, sensor histidine kinase VicK
MARSGTCKDGSIRHVLVTSNALRENGKLVSTRCFTRDVSDRWQAQELLRERGAVLHLAMNGARMGYWVGDLDRQTLRCSHELATLFGLANTFDWSLDAFLALVHPEDRPDFRRALSQSIEGHGDFLVEFRVRRDLADWRWFEGRGEAVYGEDGRPVRFYGLCMDVTARKREEQMLAHLAAVVDSADDAIVSKTLDGIVTSWNSGATRIFGYEAGEMIGRPITILIPPELHHEEALILAKIKGGARVDHYQTTRVAKDGTRKAISLAVSPVRDRNGKIVGASKIARQLKGEM